MLKHEVAPFILNLFIFNSKSGLFDSWGHLFHVKLPIFCCFTHPWIMQKYFSVVRVSKPKSKSLSILRFKTR